ncbi:MAG: hypothetical protein JXB05_22435 [Myxococcaceae bacterium]|nr:hypothetical protein [Myxococcaceae bacterium]
MAHASVPPHELKQLSQALSQLEQQGRATVSSLPRVAEATPAEAPSAKPMSPIFKSFFM